MKEQDAEAAIEFIRKCRATHEEWVGYQEKFPDWEDRVKASSVSGSIGDSDHHEKCVAEYDNVLQALGAFVNLTSKNKQGWATESSAGSKDIRIVREGKHTTVICLDDPGAGGACHEYQVVPTQKSNRPDETGEIYADISFQNGPIGEIGPNGNQNEDLLAIVIDRLKHFQKGEFPCPENKAALTFCECALEVLNKRTADRQRRGVEGKSEK